MARVKAVHALLGSLTNPPVTSSCDVKIQDIILFTRLVVNNTAIILYSIVLLISGSVRLLLRPAVLVAVAAATRYIFKQVLVC